MSIVNTRRRMSSGRRAWVVVSGVTLAAAMWSTAFPAGARVIDRERYSDTFVGHERTCGRRLRVVTTVTGIRMTKSSHGDLPSTGSDNYNIHEVLTTADGEGYVIDQAGLYHEVRVRHERGTLYRYTAINVGQVFTIRTLDGRAVERNRGLFEITFLMDTKGDSDPGNDVFREDSLRLVRDAGKHPLVTQTDAEFCAVIDEAVEGG
jgi:hypothetical protein